MIALALGLLTAASRTQPAVGYVADVTGRWYAASAPGTVVRLGTVVARGDTLRADSAARPAQSITVVLRDGTVRTAGCPLPQRPPKPAACTQLVVPSPDPATQSWMARALDEAMRLLREHEPEQYVSLVSRGAGGALADGVVRRRGERLELAPLFAQMEAGSYRVCLTRFAAPENASAMADVQCDNGTRYMWQPDRPTAVRAGALAPGLFALRVSAGGESAESWLLVTDSAHYRDQRDAFARMQAAAGSWSRGMPPSAIRRLLRAYLVHLALTADSPTGARKR